MVNPISLPAEGGDINYTVTTNPSNATVRVKCTSFTTPKATKTGKFSVPANTEGPDPKTFTLSAWCVDNASAIRTNNVTQPKQTEPVEGTIFVTPTSLDFDYLSGKQKTFTVNTTGVTSVKLASGGTNGSKFSFTPLTGTNGTVFTVETKETNLSGQDYTGIVVVSDNDGVATAREITINQKYEPIMQQFASTTFPATGGNILFTVHTDYDVVFRSVPDWITISLNGTTYAEGQRISSDVADNQTFTLTAAANTGDARTVQATFNMGHYIGNELQNRVRYFNFTQEAAEPDVPTVVSTEMFVTPGELKLADNGNAQLQVIFRTNYSNGTSYDEDITSGAGVSYAVAGNTGLIDLTSLGKVTVKSGFTGDSTAYIVVSYPGHGVEPVRVDVMVYSYFIRIPSPYGTTSWVLNPSGGTSTLVVKSERVSKVNGETISEDFPVQYAYNGGNESQKYTNISKTGDAVYYIDFSYPESTSSELDEYGRFEIKVVATDSELGVTRTGRFALKYYEPVSAYWGTSGVETTHMFSSAASQYQAKIFATSYWSASTISPWLSISPETGRGNSTIIVTCEENTKNIFRSGSITISGSDNSCSSVTTLYADQMKSGDEQPEPVKRLYILQEDFPVTSDATAISITVTCENCEFNRFNYSQTGDFNITAERSTGNTINLFFPANTGINEDSAIITFDLYDKNDNLYNDTITIRRAGAEYTPSAELEIPLHIEWNIPNGKTAFYEVRVSLMENGNEHSSASHYDTVTGDSTQDNTYEGTLQFNPTTEFDAVKITTTCVNQTEQESQIKVTVIYDQCGNDNPGEYNIINSGEAYELICDSVNSGNIDETDPVFVTIDLS